MPNLSELLIKYLEGSLTEAEAKQLSLLLEITPDELVEEELEKIWSEWKGKEVVTEERSKAILQTILQRNKIRRIPVFKWVAAASIILVMGYVLWVMVGHKSQVTGDKTQVANTNDVPAPSNTRAVITLADGSKVYLDSASNGVLAQQNNVNVVKNNGAIVYQANSQQLTANNPIYNTLTNPRGSKVIDMQLSDGSHVWLNAGSSVKYPVAFIGNERKVEITGEAYFEIAHDASKPFIVSKGQTSVTVLGTHFNVNAYDDEDAIRVTLLEGSVAVKHEMSEMRIKPGEQAIVANDIKVNKDVEVDEVLAWKNGKFLFNKTDIQTTMRQISRWYDVDIEYRGSVKGGFIGSIPRKENASQVLKMLEMTGAVHFQIEGRKIIVMP